jgi:hypothetical protein
MININYGSDTTFAIAPNVGYHIDNVIVDGSSVGTPTSYTFTNVIADHVITVSFALNTYIITASAGLHGSISPSGDVIVEYGLDQTFAIIPEVDYSIAEVLVDGGSVGAIAEYTFNGVTANHTISATFELSLAAPAITSAPVTSGMLGQLYIYDVDASGIPAPTYSLTVFPAGMTINPATGLIEWTPAIGGSYDVRVEAANQAGTDFQEFTIQVGGCDYAVGDANGNHVFNGLDVTYSVSYFKGGPPPPYSCLCNNSTWYVSGDVNASCSYNGLDVTYMVAYFKGGPAVYPCPDCPPANLLKAGNPVSSRTNETR